MMASLHADLKLLDERKKYDSLVSLLLSKGYTLDDVNFFSKNVFSSTSLTRLINDDGILKPAFRVSSKKLLSAANGDDTVQASNPKLWKSILANNSYKANVEHYYFLPSVVDGKIQVNLPTNILEFGMHEWSSCFVRSLLQFKLPLKLVEEQARKWWGNDGLQKVILHEKGYFLIKFDFTSKRDKVLAIGKKQVAYKLLLLQPWQDGVNFLMLLFLSFHYMLNSAIFVYFVGPSRF